MAIQDDKRTSLWRHYSKGMIKRKGHSLDCHVISRGSLLAGRMMANQGVTDWRFSGIKKLHQLPEVLQAKTKTSSQNNLKNFLTSYLTTACNWTGVLQCGMMVVWNERVSWEEIILVTLWRSFRTNFDYELWDSQFTVHFEYFCYCLQDDEIEQSAGDCDKRRRT